MIIVFEVIPIIFIEKRDFSISHSGLIFVGVAIGSVMGAFVNMSVTPDYSKLEVQWKGFPPPEYRLYGSMIAGPCIVTAIFWLGWTGEYPSVPWYVPALSTVLIGMSISLIFMSFMVCVIVGVRHLGY